MPHPRPASAALMVVACTALACGLYELPIDFDNTVPVVRAMRDLPPGVALVEEDLYVVESPAGVLPEGVFLSTKHVVGRIPQQLLLSGEFIRAQRLADPESGLGLSAIIPRGMRALELPGGQQVIAPLVYVDVWRTSGTPCTLQQRAFVLQVNHTRRHRDPVAADTLSLLIEPALMGPMLQASTEGALRLDVRADSDTTTQPEAACSL